jgi:hypothetical protein
MTDDFTWYENALKGIRGPIYDGEPQSGFYRQKRQDGTYEPVAYWKDTNTGEQRCHVNGKSPQDPYRGNEIWPFAARYPISAEAYWHRIDTGQWLDNDPGAAAAAKGPTIDPALDPAGSLKTEIEAAKAGESAYATIDSDEQSAKAQTLRSVLTTLKGKAEKAYEAANRPLLDEQARLRKVWFPLRDDADAASNRLRVAMGRWEDIKRENARRAADAQRKAELEAQQKAAAEAETHRRAVEAAEKANRPPPPPPEPVLAPAPVIQPNTPPPATKIKGGSGRAASVQIKRVVTAIDIDKAFKQFRESPELYAFLLDLSQKALNAGIPPDGATIEEKSDIR